MLKIIAAIAVVALVIYWFTNNKNMKTYNQYMKRKNLLEESLQNFQATQSYANQNVVMAVNENEKKFVISTMKNGVPVPLEYKFEQIIASEIQEDGKTLAAVFREGQLTGETGEDQTGAEGTAKPKSDKEAERIDLKVSVNNSQTPYVLANFLFWRISKKSSDYEKALEEAYKWQGIMESIIKDRKP